MKLFLRYVFFCVALLSFLAESKAQSPTITPIYGRWRDQFKITDSASVPPRDTLHLPCPTYKGAQATKNGVLYQYDCDNSCNCRWDSIGPQARDTLDTRFGSLKLDQPNARKTLATPKSVVVKSVADMRAFTGFVATDTQYIFSISNFTSKFTWLYQLDFTDNTTADDGALTIVSADNHRLKPVIRDYIDGRMFNMATSIADNGPLLQAAATAASTYPGTHVVLIANGNYPVTSTVTIPSNVTLRFAEGGMISGSGTINGGTIDAPMRAQIFAITLTVHPDAVASMWSMKWGGAAGSGLVNDHDALQWCWTMCAFGNKIKHIWWPSGIYRIDKGLLFERDDNGDGSRDFPTGYIIEGEGQAFGGSGEVVVNLHNDSSFALGFQKCKGLLVKNIYVDGGNTVIAGLTYSQVFEGAGSLWNSTQRIQINSPIVLFAVDPVGIPTMGAGTKYPDFVAKYTDPSNGGSTDITFDHCAAFNAIGGFGISVNGTTQNGDLIECHSCWAYQLKYAFITGSSQNRSFKINKCGVWGRVFTIFDCNTFGDNIGDPPQVEELNTAGLNKYLCSLNTFANNGLTINDSHFESLWSLGGCFPSQSGKLVINNSWVAMAGSFLPGDGTAIHPPKTIFRGSTLSMTNSFFSYYQSGSGPMSIAATQGLFNSTNLDNIVIDAVNTGVITYTHCTGGGSTYPFGDGDVIANVDPNQFQNNHTLFTTDMEFIPDVFAGDFYVSLTRKKINRTRGQFGFGGKDYQEILLGTFTPSNIVAVNGAQSSSTADITLTPGSTELKVLQIGDYLLCQTTDEYGRANSNTCMGQIYAINAGTGVVSLKTTMIGLSAISYANVRLYRQHELLAGFAVGDSHVGSNVIDNVEIESSITQFPIGATLNSNNFPEGTWIQSYNSSTHQLTVSNNATTAQTTMDILSSDWQMTQYGYPNVSLSARIGYKQGDIIWNKRQDLNADVIFFVCTQSGVTSSAKLPAFRAFYKNMAPPLANDAAANVWGITFYYNTTNSVHRIKNGATWLDVPTWDANTNITNSSGAVSINTQNGSPGLTVDALQHTLVKRGIAWQSTQSITSGTSATVGDNIITVVFDPASVIATYTLTLPATPVDGQEIRIQFGGTVAGGAAVVTSLTISANSGQALMQASAPTTANGGDCFIYQYKLSNTKWYRVK